MVIMTIYLRFSTNLFCLYYQSDALKTIVFVKKQNKIRAKKRFSMVLMIFKLAPYSLPFHWKRHKK